MQFGNFIITCIQFSLTENEYLLYTVQFPSQQPRDTHNQSDVSRTRSGYMLTASPDGENNARG